MMTDNILGAVLAVFWGRRPRDMRLWLRGDKAAAASAFDGAERGLP